MLRENLASKEQELQSLQTNRDARYVEQGNRGGVREEGVAEALGNSEGVRHEGADLHVTATSSLEPVEAVLCTCSGEKQAGDQQPLESGDKGTLKAGVWEQLKIEDQENLQTGDQGLLGSGDQDTSKDRAAEKLKIDNQEPLKAGDQEPLKAGDQEPLKAGDQEPLKAGDQEPLKAGDQEPLKAGDQEPLKAGDQDHGTLKAKEEDQLKAVDLKTGELVLGSSANNSLENETTKTELEHREGACPQGEVTVLAGVAGSNSVAEKDSKLAVALAQVRQLEEQLNGEREEKLLKIQQLEEELKMAKESGGHLKHLL